MTLTSRLIKGLLLLAAFGAVLWLGLFMTGERSGKNLFQASVFVAGNSVDPLESALTCQSRNQTTLRVSGGSGNYDWTVENILEEGTFNPTKFNLLTGTTSGGAAVSGSTIENVGDTVTLRGPTGAEPPTNHFRVNAVDHLALFWIGGTTFDVYTAPPCVERLEFFDPSPGNALFPDLGTNIVTIRNRVRVTFSNGTTRDYTWDQIQNLDIDIAITPDDGVRVDGNLITVPAERDAITITLSVDGDNVAPVYVDKSHGIDGSGTFPLDSPLVEPDSVVVYTANGNTLLTAEIDYQFNESDTTHPANDYLTLVAGSTYAGETTSLRISYFFPSGQTVTSQPLTIGGSSCDTLQTAIFEGTGGGFGADADSTSAFPNAAEPVAQASEMARGETRTLYVRGGTGNQYAWRSSDSDMLEVLALTDRESDREPLTAEAVRFNNQNLDPADFTLQPNGFATAHDCEYETDADGNRSLVACQVTVQMNVAYDAATREFPVTIATPDGPLAATATGIGDFTGTVQGTGRVTLNGGGNITATTTEPLTGSVGGDVIGGVLADVTINLRMTADKALVRLQEGDVSDYLEPPQVSRATLRNGDALPTVVDPRSVGEAVVTNIATLRANKAGRAVIYVTDQTGCTAPLDINIQQEQLDITAANFTAGDFLEVGDTVQMQATISNTTEQQTDVTNTAEWTSDDESVATVSASGLVTAVASGTANITAAYETPDDSNTTLRSVGQIPIRVSRVEGLTVTLDPVAARELAPASAYTNVFLAIHSLSALGKTITINGKTLNIVVPTEAGAENWYDFTKAEQIRGIAEILHEMINDSDDGVSDVTASYSVGLAGVISLTSTAPMTITTTAGPQELTILPALNAPLTLERNRAYPAHVIAEYDNGLTKWFNNRQGLTWVNTPVNTLDDAMLETGVVKIGEVLGDSTLHASFNNGLRDVVSNTLNFNVETGPYIEYVRLIGNQSVVRGAGLDLLIRVGDAEGISDLQEIEALLARTDSAGADYNTVLADATTQVFTLGNFPPNVVEQAAAGAPQSAAQATAEADPAADAPAPSAPEAPAVTTETAAVPFAKTYKLNVPVPQFRDLTDGAYRLLIKITDTKGQVITHVQNIRVGAVASGDVNNDGRLDINDAISAFRFYTGRATATADALQAVDTNNNGQVDLLELVTLLRTVLNRT